MKKIALSWMLGSAALGLAACSAEEDPSDDATAEATAAVEASPTATETVTTGATGGASATTAASSWPRDARIIEEGGVTYRVDANGTRVRLGDTDARILVEDGVRYRVDPGGARIRIDERGVGLDVDPPAVAVNPPEVEVETQ